MSRYTPGRIQRAEVFPQLYDLSQWRVHLCLCCYNRCPYLEGVVKGTDMRLGSSSGQHR
jgi:hypothetical protein